MHLNRSSYSSTIAVPVDLLGAPWVGEVGEDLASHYYRARYYDSHAGRFISEDPIGFEAGVNFYGYVGGNPGLYRDPSGLAEVPTNGTLPGTNIPYRMDLRQDGGKNMHVYWEGTKNGPQTIITEDGGWARKHGNKDVVPAPQKYRKVLREVAQNFVERCSRARKVLGVAGDALSLILGLAEDAERADRAQQSNVSFAEQMRRDFAGGPEVLITPIGMIPNPYRTPVIY